MHDCTHDDLLEHARTLLLSAVLDVSKVTALAGKLRACADDASRDGDAATATALSHAAEQLERRLTDG